MHVCPLICVLLPQNLRTVDREYTFPRPRLYLVHSFRIINAVSVALWRGWWV